MDDAASCRLGIDFGTSTTVAVLTRLDGRSGPLLFDSSPLLPAGVFVAPGGEILTGMDAERAAVAHPAGYEPNPKQRIADGTVWLGEREIPVVDLVAAVLGRVAAEARRVAGGTPTSVVLTHPVGWAGGQLAVLAEAARRAGLGEVRFVAEPVAAAAYFVAVLGRELPPGRPLVVYDLGAGTFDVAVVRPRPDGLDVVAAVGLGDVGGIDLDAVVVDHLRAATGAEEAWRRLDLPGSAADRRFRHDLWRGARAAKEQLSRQPAVDVHVPLVDVVTRLTRDEFEAAARPHLDRVTALTLAVLRDAGVRPDQVAGVFLVGGASRVPLAGTLVHRAVGVPPTIIEQPELVVAQGSLLVGATRPAGPATAPSETSPQGVLAQPSASWPVASGSVAGAEVGPYRGKRAGRWIAAVASVVVVLLAVGVSVAVWRPWDGRRVDTGTPVATPSATPSPVTVDQPVLGAVFTGTLTGHTDDVWRIAFGPNDDIVATTGRDGTVRLWDPARHEPIGGPLVGHTDPVHDLEFSPDGKLLVSASYDATVRLWDVASREPIGDPMTGHQLLVFWVAFSPDGKIIASSDGSRIRLWDVATQRQLGDPITLPSDANSQIAFSTDGTSLALVSRRPVVYRWDVATRELISAPTDGPVPGQMGQFSPDGATLAVGKDDEDLQLWDVAEGRLIETLPDSAGNLVSMALSSHSRTLAVVNFDADLRWVVQLWDVERRERIGDPLEGHTERVEALAFSPGGRYFATSADDSTVRIYRLVH